MRRCEVPSAVALACSSSGILRSGDGLVGFCGVFVAGIGSGSFDRFPFCVLPDLASEAALRFDSKSTLEQCPFCSNLAFTPELYRATRSDCQWHSSFTIEIEKATYGSGSRGNGSRA